VIFERDELYPFMQLIVGISHALDNFPTG